MKHLVVPRALTYALWDTAGGMWGDSHVIGCYGRTITSPRDPLWEELRSVVEILSLVDPGRYNPALEEMREWEKPVEKSGKWMAGPPRSVPTTE